MIDKYFGVVDNVSYKEYERGNCMTIKEIANLAGVSISTVSKIVNNKADNINIDTRNRVLKIVKEYNYIPYGTAKNSSNAKNFVIGILMKKAVLDDCMLKGILKEAQKHGYNILICESMSSEENELKHITALCKHHVDGVVWEPVSEKSMQYQHYFDEQNICVSYVNTPYSQTSHCLDFIEMGYYATQKLLDEHHTQIACLLNDGSYRANMIFEGYKKCLFDNEIPFSDEKKYLHTDESVHKKLFLQGVTGVVCSHFDTALSLYEKVTDLHYNVPSDLSLISFREDTKGIVSYPKIASVRIPYEAFGEKVCKQLISVCESLNESDFSLFSPEKFLMDNEESITIPSSLRYKKIVSVGSINTDITLNVDVLPHPGSTVITTASTMTLGGKGANQAIGAARLGHEVVLIGKVGNDYDSTIILETLNKEHVLTQGISRDSNVITGKAYIHVSREADSCITVLPGANQNLLKEDILYKKHLFKNCGYCMISTEIPLVTCVQTAIIAHEYGAKNIVKPAALTYLPEELIKNTDIFIPNKFEAELLCPDEKTVEKQSEYFRNLGCPIVIITLGQKGLYVKTDQIEGYFSAADFPSIDSTGGADAFIAALASYLTEGYPLLNAVKIATYAAGFCVSRTGVVPSLIDRISLENHIKMKEPDILKQI